MLIVLVIVTGSSANNCQGAAGYFIKCPGQAQHSQLRTFHYEMTGHF